MVTQIQDAFSQPLPGVEAQYRMAHSSRLVPSTVRDDAKESAVLVLFYPKFGEWHIALIQRTNNNPNDRHGGQISFPGGRKEDADENLQVTALRETEEEIGIPQKDIQILGALTDLYIPVSNFNVQPFVGVLDYTPQFIPQASEVERILSPTFAHLQQKDTIKHTDMRFSPHLIVKRIPYFAVGGHIVWGATAMIINEVLAMIEA